MQTCEADIAPIHNDECYRCYRDVIRYFHVGRFPIADVYEFGNVSADVEPCVHFDRTLCALVCRPGEHVYP